MTKRDTMTLDEALAVWPYAKDNTEGEWEPARSARREAWAVICKYATDAILRHANEQGMPKEGGNG